MSEDAKPRAGGAGPIGESGAWSKKGTFSSESKEIISMAELRRSRREENLPIVGNVARRLRRRRDARTLVDLSNALAAVQNETLYLNAEISLSSTATSFFNEIRDGIKNAPGNALDAATKESSNALGDLFKAATSSLTGQAPPKPREMDTAGERAQAAVNELTASMGLSDWGKRLDEAWRRDAIRAIVSLQRAPEEMVRLAARHRLPPLAARLPPPPTAPATTPTLSCHPCACLCQAYAIRRQRLKVLKGELRVLGLDKKQLHLITEADVRGARVKKAKALQGVRPKRDLFGAARMAFGSLTKETPREEDLAREAKQASYSEEMTKVNVAYEAVLRAVS